MNVFPRRIVDSVNGMVGRVKIAVVRALSFNPTIPYLLELKDQDGEDIASVEIGIENIKDLSDSLGDKQGKLSSSDESIFIDQDINDIKVNVEGWDLATDLNEITPNITVN